MRPAWAVYMIVAVLAGSAGAVTSLVATHLSHEPVPTVVAISLDAPAPALTPVAVPPLPVFVPTLAWALEGPAPLRAARLDRVRRFWGILGELRCPTSNRHDCVVVHPALGEMA